MIRMSRCRIGDLGKVVTGRTPPSTKPECFGEEFPFITPSDMDGRKTIRTTERYLSDAGYALLRSNLLTEKCVAVSCIGWQMGKSALTSRTSFTNQQLNSIIPDRSLVDADYLYYVLSTRREELKRLGSVGTRTPILNKSAFCALQVEVPELAVQRSIASILSAYDDLIENNTRRISVLKNMAKTIFQGAAADSWSVVPVSELYEELFDGPHATPKPSTTGPIYLGIKNVTERGELDLTDIRHIAEEDFSQWTRRVVPRPGDIVFTYEATLNRYGIINRDFRGCLGRRMALIRPDERQIDPYLFLHCLLSDQWRNEVRSKIISGATVDRIPLTTFPTFHIRVPNADLRARIGPVIRACEELAENCRRRNDVLRTTRDLLLPKLISGEIPVEAAEEAMEQTA